MINKLKLINKTNNYLIGYLSRTRRRHLLLHMRKTRTNIFFTLTNLNANKVFFVITAGLCCYGNKRRKNSLQTVELMIDKLLIFLRRYNIKGLHIKLKSKLPSYLRTLVKDFKYRGFSILSFEDLKKVAHNGVRVRKIRRT